MSIDSRVLFGIMREISPEVNVSRELSGENRETYWKNIFDSKRLRVSRKKVFTGLIETDGVAVYVHYRRLKKDRTGSPLASLVTKDEDEKEEDPATQKVQDNDLVVDVTKDEEKEEAEPALQKVQDNEFVVGADPETQISFLSQNPNVRKMVLTVTCFRKICFC